MPYREIQFGFDPMFNPELMFVCPLHLDQRHVKCRSRLIIRTPPVCSHPRLFIFFCHGMLEDKRSHAFVAKRSAFVFL